ncbi:MAG: glutamyl-tRNA reductase [Halobacteriales archaeon]|jgi:glutamyl-tRNA reductase
MDGLHGAFLTHQEVSPSGIADASEDDPARVLSHLRAKGAEEAFVLQTCNRVEYYVRGDDDPLRTGIETFGLPGDAVEIAHGLSVARHALRVASGLESMVVGEDEIIGQFTEARDEADGYLGGPLEVVLDKAIRTGKRVRADTRINEGHTSIATAAVELASRRLDGLEGIEALVVGTGDMGRQVSKTLIDRGATVVLANRTYETAKSWADEIGATAVNGTDLTRQLADADLVVSATDAPHPIFHRGDFEDASVAVAVDLATPPDIGTDVEAASDTVRLDLTDVESVVDDSKHLRRTAIDRAESIIASELDHLENLLKQRRAERMLSAIYRQAESIRQEEAERALRSLDSSDEAVEEVLETCTQSIVNRLLATPTQSIKEAAVAENYETLETVADVFEVADRERIAAETEPVNWSSDGESVTTQNNETNP